MHHHTWLTVRRPHSSQEPASLIISARTHPFQFGQSTTQRPDTKVDHMDDVPLKSRCTCPVGGWIWTQELSVKLAENGHTMQLNKEQCVFHPLTGSKSPVQNHILSFCFNFFLSSKLPAKKNWDFQWGPNWLIYLLHKGFEDLKKKCDFNLRLLKLTLLQVAYTLRVQLHVNMACWKV